jgi:hypothetical protein
MDTEDDPIEYYKKRIAEVERQIGNSETLIATAQRQLEQNRGLRDHYKRCLERAIRKAQKGGTQ